MSIYVIRNTFNNDIGDSEAKLVLLWLSYCCTTSFAEISQHCEMDIDMVIDNLNYLSNQGFIRRRNGSVDHEDPNQEVYQWELLVPQMVRRK